MKLKVLLVKPSGVADEISGMILVDTENGEKIEPVSETYKVRISETRARLFYLR